MGHVTRLVIVSMSFIVLFESHVHTGVFILSLS